jgi:hypothetical protein
VSDCGDFYELLCSTQISVITGLLTFNLFLLPVQKAKDGFIPNLGVSKGCGRVSPEPLKGATGWGFVVVSPPWVVPGCVPFRLLGVPFLVLPPLGVTTR